MFRSAVRPTAIRPVPLRPNISTRTVTFERPRTRRRSLAAILAPALIAIAAAPLIAGCGDTERATELAEGAPGTGHVARNTDRPRIDNVLLVVADTFRADRLGAYGAERVLSPNLDALARRGTVWTRNHSQGPWTVPSMISMMTGLYVTEETRALPTDRGTLPELVSEAGVETAAFVGNPVAGVSRGFQRGFDHYEESRRGGTPAGQWGRSFVAWHEARTEPERPWFAWVHFMDTHAPHDPLPQFDRWRVDNDFPGRKELVPRWRDARKDLEAFAPEGAPMLSHLEAGRRMGARRNSYDGEVAAIDAGFGRIVDHLHRTGELETTLVVFAADHGELLYEYPQYRGDLERFAAKNDGFPDGLEDWFAWGHRAWFYDEVWRTPLIMSGPGIDGGARLGELSANLDIAPTVLEALGAEVPSDLDGRSKFGLTHDRAAVFSHGHLTTAMVTQDGLQLIEHRPERLGTQSDAQRYEVFEHARRDRFLVDLVATEAFDVAPLLGQLEDWRRNPKLTQNFRVDERAQKILRDLGYLDTPEAEVMVNRGRDTETGTR